MPSGNRIGSGSRLTAVFRWPERRVTNRRARHERPGRGRLERLGFDQLEGRVVLSGSQGVGSFLSGSYFAEPTGPEPNDSFASAITLKPYPAFLGPTQLGWAADAYGVIGDNPQVARDRDFYRIWLYQNEQVTFLTDTTIDVVNPVDTTLLVVGPNNFSIFNDDYAFTSDSNVTFTVPTTGQYYAIVAEWDGASFGGDYWLIADVSSWLDPARSFRPESELYSDNGRFRLTLQSDGNLVLYDEGGVSTVSATAVWNSGTSGNPGAYAVHQADGNLVVYSAANRPLMSTGTQGNPGSTLKLEDNGRLTLRSASGVIVWQSPTPGPGIPAPPPTPPGRWEFFNMPLGMPERITAGWSLRSDDGRYRMTMQSDGNLVLYEGSRALWHTQTSGNPGAYAVIQGDGNFVVYSATNRPLWFSRTQGNSNATIALGDDGNLVLRSASGATLWQTGTSQTPAPPPPSPSPPTSQGTVWRAGDSLTSNNGSYRVVMQSDGNLVLYAGSRALWHTQTSGNPGAYAVLQGDGNLVVYSAANRPLAFSGTQGTPGATIALGDDGNLVLRSASGATLWQTGTSQTPAPPPPNPLDNRDPNWYVGTWTNTSGGTTVTVTFTKLNEVYDEMALLWGPAHTVRATIQFSGAVSGSGSVAVTDGSSPFFRPLLLPGASIQQISARVVGPFLRSDGLFDSSFGVSLRSDGEGSHDRSGGRIRWGRA
jgi:hypothetical protein